MSEILTDSQTSTGKYTGSYQACFGLATTLGSRPSMRMARSWSDIHAGSTPLLDSCVIWASLPHLGVMSGESRRLGVVMARSWRGNGAWITLGRENEALLGRCHT
ncbi:hypothetical protein PIB30_025146 [Stylosanthes scabra]|uniref:Uncharacterized protein n=1 Tax=Stylosanthes scabra TaxID=79078 RepID=A0ABU6X7I3_9FABA|nr:hypothetical protein [Stylosanthes scabra]